MYKLEVLEQHDIYDGDLRRVSMQICIRLRFIDLAYVHVLTADISRRIDHILYSKSNLDSEF